MTRPNRSSTRYQRQAETERTTAAEGERSRREAEASHRRGLFAAGERERWAGVDPDQRVCVVKPFGLSAHHGIGESDLRRFLEIKAATLGYLGSVIRECDETTVSEFPGHPGSVAGQRDAERLVAALAREYPAVPFRIELAPYVVDLVEWERPDAEQVRI